MKPTTFVIGAGVSMPFGFPSGLMLMEEVAESTKSRTIKMIRAQSQYSHALSHVVFNDHDRQMLYELGLGVERGGARSVDDFVETNSKFDPYARSLVAAIMLKYESSCLKNVFRSKNLFNRYGEIDHEGYSRGGNAIRHIFEQIRDSLKNPTYSAFQKEMSKHSFVTFNYDRALEHYLYNTILYGYRQDPWDAEEGLMSADITHVYGSLGTYRPETIELIVAAPEDDPIKDWDTIHLNALNSINFIDRKGDRDQTVHSIASSMRGKDQIIVLGFGYDKTNLSILRDAYVNSEFPEGSIPTVIKKSIQQKWKGSAYGKTKLERDQAFELLPIMPSNQSDPHQDDVEFMRNYIDFRIQ